MKKKYAFWFIILVVGILLFPRLYVLTLSAWDYFQTEEYCTDGKRPRTPAGDEVLLRIWIHEVKPYTVITSKGRIYPGEEYDMYGEGAWYGYVTLLFAGKDGASFLVTYPNREEKTRHDCRWYVPIGYYRD